MMLAPNASNGLGMLAVQALVVLAAIAAIAWLATRVVMPRLGLRGKSARMRVVERLPLEPRRSLYIVEVDGRCVLVGVADSGITMVADLSTPPEQGLRR